MQLDILLDKLKTLQVERRPIVIAGVGCGLTARAAVMGGADLLAVYSTAIYRVRGLPTALSFLPYDNANDITFSVAPEVLANAGDVPVLFGLGAHDPRTTPRKLVEKALSYGACGVLNEPFIGMYKPHLSRQLEEAGLGFSREVEMIKCAVKIGLITLGWVFNPHEAKKMVEVGAQVIGGMVALSESCNIDQMQTKRLDDAIGILRSIIISVKAIREEVFVIGHGDPLNTPLTVTEVINQTKMDGYFTGSTGERFPVEKGVAKMIRQYKNIVPSI